MSRFWVPNENDIVVHISPDKKTILGVLDQDLRNKTIKILNWIENDTSISEIDKIALREEYDAFCRIVWEHIIKKGKRELFELQKGILILKSENLEDMWWGNFWLDPCFKVELNEALELNYWKIRKIPNWCHKFVMSYDNWTIHITVKDVDNHRNISCPWKILWGWYVIKEKKSDPIFFWTSLEYWRFYKKILKKMCKEQEIWYSIEKEISDKKMRKISSLYNTEQRIRWM